MAISVVRDVKFYQLPLKKEKLYRLLELQVVGGNHSKRGGVEFGKTKDKSSYSSE